MAFAPHGPGGKKDEDDDGGAVGPFLQGLDKGIVLQETRVFSETPLDPRACSLLLTKILFLLSQGETLTRTEATDVFFGITKLFSSKDIPLRRMVYLALKELAPFADNVIIVMASLTKDMNGREDIFQANAIRVLCQVTDPSLLQQIERYLKQAIVHKEPHVSSAALTAGAHLFGHSPDIVKRWAPEVQEALHSSHPMVQYHAIGLLQLLKQHDRLAVSKLVQTMIKSTIRSPYAHCMLIRYTSQVMIEDPRAAEHGFYSYLESCLRHKSEMVIFEAARAICGLPGITPRELTPAITVLQLFLSSPKPSLRFAAVRTLNKVAQDHPQAVATCNLDMENLISDSNRSVATFAITTLLKTGSESSVDSLMKQISGFMGEISDEFRTVVVEAVRSLCLKFPAKHRGLLAFLANALRDDGGFEYKRCIVDAVLAIVQDVPETVEVGLTHLCEFIEDCEFTQLSVQILHVLGSMGPATSVPTRFIRYIFNRISLENATVRAAAVSSLSKFGVALPAVRPKIIVLLKRCLLDSDDEVRDRAVISLKLLERQNEADSEHDGKDNATAAVLRDLVGLTKFQTPLVNLQIALEAYKLQGDAAKKPFDISSVPMEVHLSKKQRAARRAEVEAKRQREIAQQRAAAAAGDAEAALMVYAEQLQRIPQFAELGKLWSSSKAQQLTEAETEYRVTCVKHIFSEHVVLQFDIQNTLDDMQLEDVSAHLNAGELSGARVESDLPLRTLPPGGNGSCFVCLRRPAGEGEGEVCPPVTGAVPVTLKFQVVDVDPATGDSLGEGYDDQYELEDADLSCADYIKPAFAADFQERWESIGDEFECVETYALSTMQNLAEAVQAIKNQLGMAACDRSDQVSAKRTKHILYLAGSFAGEVPVAVRSRMKFVEGAGVQMELTVRSSNDDVSMTVASAI
jgi:coatomer subunit gamma